MSGTHAGWPSGILASTSAEGHNRPPEHLARQEQVAWPLDSSVGTVLPGAFCLSVCPGLAWRGSETYQLYPEAT